jgi:hypothetical protein
MFLLPLFRGNVAIEMAANQPKRHIAVAVPEDASSAEPARSPIPGRASLL